MSDLGPKTDALEFTNFRDRCHEALGVVSNNSDTRLLVRSREFSIARNDATYSCVRRNARAMQMYVLGIRIYENIAASEQALVNRPELIMY